MIIIENPVHTKFISNKKGYTTSSVNNEKYNDNWLISQIINGVQDKTQQELRRISDLFTHQRNQDPSVWCKQKKHHKNRNNQEDLRVITYEQLENLMTRYWIPDLLPDPDGTGNMMFSNINTRKLQDISKLHKNHDKFICKSSATDMENNSYTHCFGVKFLPI